MRIAPDIHHTATPFVSRNQGEFRNKLPLVHMLVCPAHAAQLHLDKQLGAADLWQGDGFGRELSRLL